ncbi:MAG: LuxR family transcriptional regulator [Rhodobacteraceae bacterium]|nr:LuxR family transcriptional regulator [Paracoccaceae bacterium]
MDLVDLSTIPDGDIHFQDFIDQLCEKLELEYASYATTNPVNGAVQGYANYPDEWKKHYIGQAFQEFDPTLHATSRSVAPIEWRRFKRNADFRRVFDAAGEFGVSSQGLSIPIRGMYGDSAIFSVTRNCDDREWGLLLPEIIVELQMSAVHMHDAVLRSSLLMKAIAKPALSGREKEILQWTAAGKSQADIGDILGISNRTVEVHIRSAREKIGALSTTQAVARAVSMGIIHAI